VGRFQDFRGSDKHAPSGIDPPGQGR
jgi:hypothetical protein